jgi:hypothetical protein
MATFNYPAIRSVADKLIQQFGMRASLIRGGVYRDCWVVITDYNPKDAESQLANPTDRQVIISAGLGGVPAMPPDESKGDQLVTYIQPVPAGSPWPPLSLVNEVLPFTTPMKPISPAGIVVVYQGTVKR